MPTPLKVEVFVQLGGGQLIAELLRYKPTFKRYYRLGVTVQNFVL